MGDRRHELGHQKISKLLLRYSTPAIVAMLVNSMYNIVDMIFIGQGAGSQALAGLATALPIQMFVLAIAQTVGLGSASIISRSLGAGDSDKANRTAGTALSTIAILSVILTVSFLIFLDPVLRLAGANEEILPYAHEYLFVIMAGSFFFSFSVTSNVLARSEGNIKVAMKSMILGALLNAAMDPILIFDWGFGLGIRGAAISTVLAHIATFAYLTRYFASGKSLLKINRKNLIPDVSLWPEIFKIGASSFMRTVAGAVLAIVANNTIMHYGSGIHLAAFLVANRVMLLTVMPMFGLIQGLLPIIGFNYGARKIGRAKEALLLAIRSATIYCSAGALLLAIFTPYVVMLFGREEQLVTHGVTIIRIIVLFMPLIGIQIVGASLFQALGKALPAILLSMSRQILFLVPFILLLPHFYDLDGVWYAFPLSDLLATCVTMVCVLWQIRIFNRMEAEPTKPGT